MTAGVSEMSEVGPLISLPADASAGTIHFVGIGALVVACAPDRLRTVLGSCVGIVIFDTAAEVAGLAHSILPAGHEEAEELGKFADQAVDNLLIRLTREGANKANLQAKLIGGAAMFGNETTMQLGARNVDAASARLEAHEIPIVATSVGGTKGRKVLLDARTGEVAVAAIGEESETI